MEKLFLRKIETMFPKLLRAAWNPDIPIIVQTAYAQSEEKEVTMKAGADAYLVKPIDQNELKKIISSICHVDLCDNDWCDNIELSVLKRLAVNGKLWIKLWK